MAAYLYTQQSIVIIIGIIYFADDAFSCKNLTTHT